MVSTRVIEVAPRNVIDQHFLVECTPVTGRPSDVQTPSGQCRSFPKKEHVKEWWGGFVDKSYVSPYRQRRFVELLTHLRHLGYQLEYGGLVPDYRNPKYKNTSFAAMLDLVKTGSLGDAGVIKKQFVKEDVWEKAAYDLARNAQRMPRDGEKPLTVYPLSLVVRPTSCHILFEVYNWITGDVLLRRGYKHVTHAGRNNKTYERYLQFMISDMRAVLAANIKPDELNEQLNNLALPLESPPISFRQTVASSAENAWEKLFADIENPGSSGPVDFVEVFYGDPRFPQEIFKAYVTNPHPSHFGPDKKKDESVGSGSLQVEGRIWRIGMDVTDTAYDQIKALHRAWFLGKKKIKGVIMGFKLDEKGFSYKDKFGNSVIFDGGMHISIFPPVAYAKSGEVFGSYRPIDFDLTPLGFDEYHGLFGQKIWREARQLIAGAYEYNIYDDLPEEWSLVVEREEVFLIGRLHDANHYFGFTPHTAVTDVFFSRDDKPNAFADQISPRQVAINQGILPALLRQKQGTILRHEVAHAFDNRYGVSDSYMFEEIFETYASAGQFDVFHYVAESNAYEGVEGVGGHPFENAGEFFASLANYSAHPEWLQKTRTMPPHVQVQYFHAVHAVIVAIETQASIGGEDPNRIPFYRRLTEQYKILDELIGDGAKKIIPVITYKRAVERLYLGNIHFDSLEEYQRKAAGETTCIVIPYPVDLIAEGLSGGFAKLAPTPQQFAEKVLNYVVKQSPDTTILAVPYDRKVFGYHELFNQALIVQNGKIVKRVPLSE